MLYALLITAPPIINSRREKERERYTCGVCMMAKMRGFDLKFPRPRCDFVFGAREIALLRRRKGERETDMHAARSNCFSCRGDVTFMGFSYGFTLDVTAFNTESERGREYDCTLGIFRENCRREEEN